MVMKPTMSGLNDLIKIVVICGPTGIGKTSCAIQMARGRNGRIISADSMSDAAEKVVQAVQS